MMSVNLKPILNYVGQHPVATAIMLVFLVFVIIDTIRFNIWMIKDMFKRK